VVEELARLVDESELKLMDDEVDESEGKLMMILSQPTKTIVESRISQGNFFINFIIDQTSVKRNHEDLFLPQERHIFWLCGLLKPQEHVHCPEGIFAWKRR
jgi:hypothetical protein